MESTVSCSPYQQWLIWLLTKKNNDWGLQCVLNKKNSVSKYSSGCWLFFMHHGWVRLPEQLCEGKSNSHHNGYPQSVVHTYALSRLNMNMPLLHTQLSGNVIIIQTGQCILKTAVASKWDTPISLYLNPLSWDILCRHTGKVVKMLRIQLCTSW